ncbi:conserved hypothetical protein [delta proteobacterium NaphS2]|nr:conserved hypothetical protein [delta proteobacterium NaphS2]
MSVSNAKVVIVMNLLKQKYSVKRGKSTDFIKLPELPAKGGEI